MKNFFIIAQFFDFLLSTNLIRPESQNLLYSKLDFFDYNLFSHKLFLNFYQNGGIENYVNLEYTQSYAYKQFLFLSKEKKITYDSLKNFLLNFKDSNKILKSEDNISLMQKPNKMMQHVNGYAIIRSFAYLINNLDNKDSFEESIRIARLANNHPIEVIGTYILHLSMKYINKNKNPYKLFNIILDELEELQDKSNSKRKVLMGEGNEKEFDKFLIEITANLFEFVRINYVNKIPNKIVKDNIINTEYINFVSQIIYNNYTNKKNVFICGNAASVIFVAIDLYIEYFKLYLEREIIPINKIIMSLAGILGFSHHSTLIFSYFIYLLDDKKFINSISKKIYKTIK